MGHLSALWSSIIFDTLKELVSFFIPLNYSNNSSIHFYHAIGSENVNGIFV